VTRAAPSSLSGPAGLNSRCVRTSCSHPRPRVRFQQSGEPIGEQSGVSGEGRSLSRHENTMTFPQLGQRSTSKRA